MMDKTLRHALPAREASERIKDFFEVSPGFSEQTALAEAARCLSCKNAPCMKGCPVGVHIPDFIAALRTEGAQAAAAVISADNNLPAVCGRVCPQENQCEKFCIRREKLGGSVSIGALERFVADHAPETEKTRPAPCGISVAVVGSGPAGLSCAADLAKAGAKVTVFEALHKAGGVLEYGIPEFRLPKAVVDKEIKALEALGVEIRCDEVVGRSVTLPELMETHDAVFIGSGAGLPLFLGIEGETLCGVLSANELLTRVNLMKAYREDAVTPVPRGKNVVVVGAGNVAMDARPHREKAGGGGHSRLQKEQGGDARPRGGDSPRRRGGDKVRASDKSRPHTRRRKGICLRGDLRAYAPRRTGEGRQAPSDSRGRQRI